MPEVKLTAELRTEFGKGAARRIRRADKVPAVLYGHGTDPIHISLPGHETLLALRTANALLSIDVNGDSQLALPKQVQRDPLKHTIEHVDLVIVRRGEKVTVDIRIQTEGEAAAETLVVVDQNTVAVEAEATHIPQQITVSIEGLEAGTQILARDLTLPSRVPLAIDPETLVVNITAAQTEEQAEAELAEAEAEAGIEPTLTEEYRGRGRGCGRGASPARTTSPDAVPGCPHGWWSASVIPVRPSPDTGTTSASWWPRSSPTRIGARFGAAKGMRAEVAEGRLGLPGADAVPRLTLVKPRTFMNDTGAAVARLLAYFKIGLDRLVAVHDELDIDPGQIRVKFGGGDNGHNGLRSMRSPLGSGDFFRVRVGIGRPPGRQDPADFLLSDFSARPNARRSARRWSGPPTPWSPWSPTASNAPSPASTPNRRSSIHLPARAASRAEEEGRARSVTGAGDRCSRCRPADPLSYACAASVRVSEIVIGTPRPRRSGPRPRTVVQVERRKPPALLCRLDDSGGARDRRPPPLRDASAGQDNLEPGSASSACRAMVAEHRSAARRPSIFRYAAQRDRGAVRRDARWSRVVPAPSSTGAGRAGRACLRS